MLKINLFKRTPESFGKTILFLLIVLEVVVFYFVILDFDIEFGLNTITYHYLIRYSIYAFIWFLISYWISKSIKTADQWEKAVVLRLGKFQGLKGPGLFFIIPIIDQVNKYIDQRVQVSSYSAEKTLTKDTVPVNVDIVTYWTVWDAEKAALEVQAYVDAVSFAAQTGLRDIIGKHELSDLLQNREQIAEDLQHALDEQTNPWGITCQSVGIRDIVIPKELSNAMSKQAQAERERQARIILSNAEEEIANQFSRASEKYQNNPVALQLRGMNMLYEGLKEKGSMIIVPSSALDSMNMGAIAGMTALARESGKDEESDK